MKNKISMVIAVIVAAVIAGGATGWVVSKTNQNLVPSHTTTVSGSFDGAGAGAHFTSYTPQGYPDLTYAAENAVKAVVGVINTQEIPQSSYRGGSSGNPFFDFFGIPEGYEGFGGPQGPQGPGGQNQGPGQQNQQNQRPREQRSGGSGVIISPDGYIVTNHHVVEGASRLSVKLPDGKIYDARLVGTDADTEIALIKIEATDLPSIPFGDSDALRLGEWVLAIGNPYDLHSTVTAGIVSAKGRSLGAIQSGNGSGNTGIESFIQTDAAVNPGNSGGALVNTAGELVGINTLLISRTGGYVGYSFAVPETIVRKVTSDLREYGIVQRGLIGIAYNVIDENFIEARGEELGITEPGGIYVGQVVEDGAAQAAGIREGDIITAIDDEPVTGSATLAEIIGLKRPGDVIKISAKRGDNVKQFEVVLRNRAGGRELLPANSFDAMKELGGEFAEITLSSRQKRELDISGGIRVASIDEGGLLSRAGVRRDYIITHINGNSIRTVSDLYRITERITTIEGIYPNGRSVTYSIAQAD
ncbi:MAG: trypsin-like peptidase domain-containing protein [Alistipes sp.]|jgi:Do/DeqQ family serine protease|nr:trypsin-like peptidase domain-containing protein [Alistipes sp.]